MSLWATNPTVYVAIPASEAVDGGDVRMVQRGQHPGLALEALEAVGIGRDVFGQRLQRHRSPQPRVVREEGARCPEGSSGSGRLTRGGGCIHPPGGC